MPHSKFAELFLFSDTWNADITVDTKINHHESQIDERISISENMNLEKCSILFF